MSDDAGVNRRRARTAFQHGPLQKLKPLWILNPDGPEMSKHKWHPSAEVEGGLGCRARFRGRPPHIDDDSPPATMVWSPSLLIALTDVALVNESGWRQRRRLIQISYVGPKMLRCEGNLTALRNPEKTTGFRERAQPNYDDYSHTSSMIRRISTSGRPQGAGKPVRHVGPKPLILLNGLPGPRGRPDPEHRRFPAGPKNGESRLVRLGPRLAQT